MPALFSRFLLLVLACPLLAWGADSPPLTTINDPTPANKQDSEVRLRARELAEAHDMDGLEALASELRTSRAALTSGWWILTDFYDSATALSDDKDEAEATVKFFESWASEHPKSITAQICLAEVYTSYAWNARGSGWASSVTKEGWELFRERLNHAWEILKEADKLEEKCPQWYAAAQIVALGQGWDHAEYFAMVNEAIAKEPTYGAYYRNACYWMLPRWNGEEGDFEKWLAKEADKVPADQRDLQYARLVWWASLMPVGGEIVFETGRLDWDRTKRGFHQWIAEKPDNLMLHFILTQMALDANDRETTRAQLEATKGLYYPRLWRGMDEFEAAQAFAFHGGPNPELAPEERRQSHPLLTPEQIEMAKMVVKLVIGFLGGLIAGGLLLGLALQRQALAAGIIAFFACLILGMPLGTMATALAAAGLWWYLQRKPNSHPPELNAPSGWMVLLWVIVLAGCYIGFQMVATALSAVAFVIEAGSDGAEESIKALFSSGATSRSVISSIWLCFLGLLVIVGPQNRDTWRKRLALRPCTIQTALLWCIPIGVAIAALNFASEAFTDERTRKALEFLSLAVASPVSFILAVAIAAPIFEELLFRGYAFTGWVEKIGFQGAALASTALFTVSHLQYGWAGLLFAFVFGYLLCLVRWKTGSIYPTIVLHGLNNLIYSLFVFFGYGE